MRSHQINLQTRFPQHRATGRASTFSTSSTLQTVYPPAESSSQSQLPAPLFTLPPSPFTSHSLFTLSCENAAAAIYYTLDGSTPTAASTLYTAPFAPYQVGEITIKAIAILEGFLDSDISEETVTLTALPLAQPVLTLSSILDVSMLASWDEVTNANGYILDVALDSGFTSFLSGWQAKDVGDVTSISVPGLTPATTYYFRLKAYHAWGQSSPSDTASTMTYIHRADARFIIDPQRPELFEYSADGANYSPCVVNGEIVNSRVNRITCAVTGTQITSDTLRSALDIKKSGSYYYLENGAVAWLYNASFNLLSTAGQQITGVFKHPVIGVMHYYDSTYIGSFVGRSGSNDCGIFRRRQYLAPAGELQKSLLRSISCTDALADTVIIRNLNIMTPSYNTGMLVNISNMGNLNPSYRFVLLHIWAIYSPTSDQVIILNRHNAIARYLGGIGGPVIEDYSA